MSARAKRALVLVATGAVALAAAPAPAGSAPVDARKPPRKRVDVADNFFGPTKLTVKAGTKIVWRWSEDAANIHDVKLTSHPKGVRRFRSVPASAGYVYAKTLTKPGTYRIVCTLHVADDMRMTIKVRR
jgi:plastocyanin